MSNNSLQSRVQQFRDRACLSRWFPDNLTDGENQLTFGKTEMGIIEEVLRRLERRESLLIHNPIPSDRLPVGILSAFVRTQDPRFPTKGIVGRGWTLLSFPALHQGYVSTLDDLREDTIGRSVTVIDREPVSQLSAVTGEADLYTANNNFEFDRRTPPGYVGFVFVDLRKPEWGELARRFDEIMALRETLDCPFVLYTDEMTPAAKTLADELPTRRVTNDLLAEATEPELPDNPSLTTRFEYLINHHDLTAEQINVASPAMRRILPDLTAMRDDIQRSHDMDGVVTMEVGWLYNLLTKLPVRPEYWDRAVESNYYQQGVRELLENLRGKAQRMEGRASSVLINYCQAADELHGRLNTDHPIQEVLFQLITEEADIDTRRTVIVNSDFERKAILQALTLEDRRLADAVSIETVDEIEPDPELEYVVARPLDADSFVYDFPIGTRVAFLQYDHWNSLIEQRLEEGLASVGATIESKMIGDTEEKPSRSRTGRGAAPPDPGYEPVDDADMDDVNETLQNDFQSGGEGRGPTGGGGSASNPDLAVTLSTGETREWSEQSRVSVLKENGDIGRKPAKELTTGDTVVLLDTVADDIYDIFVESAHQKEQLRKSESVVERWRTILDEAIAGDWTEAEVLEAIQEEGSDISDIATISNWRTGEAIGPRDPEDVRRVLTVLKPEMEPTSDATVEAMKHIRKEHRDIGRRARRAIENQMGGGIASSVTTDVPDDVDVGAEEVRKATVESITVLDQ